MKKLIMLFVCLFIIWHAKPQGIENPNEGYPEIKLPTILPTSPDVASLGRFGDIPVGHSTGVANVSIPIHTLIAGKVEIPISLSYHGSGFRVTEIASSVGLGWSLQAGGVISREIRGMPDEMDYLVGASAFEEDGTPYMPSCTEDVAVSQYHMHAVNGTLVDTEPDLYSFNFLGYSGKFVMDVDGNLHITPAGEVTIERKVDEATGSSYYKIGDFQGNVYYFGANDEGIIANQEQSSSDLKQDCNYGGFSGGEYGGVTAWHLTTIITAEGQRIDFDYRSESQKYNISGNGEYVHKLMGSGVPEEMLGAKYCERTEVSHSAYNLVKITTPTQEIKFSYSTTRCDFEPGTEAKMLDKIEVIGFQNYASYFPYQTLKEFNLKHSYFGPTEKASNCDNSGRNLRLRFDEISQIGYDGSELTYYRAEYFSQSDLNIYSAWPATTSFSQDHWGFFNGANNSSLDPSLGAPYYISRASRGSSKPHTMLGVLKRLYYPTGGYTDFAYEHNEYKGGEGNDVVINEPEPKYGLALADVYYQENIRQDYDSAHFTLEEEKNVTIYCDFQGSNLDLMAFGFGYVRIFQPGENGINHVYQPDIDCGAENNVILPAGDYILEAVLQSDVQPSSILFKLVWEDGYTEGDTTISELPKLTAGGLRISSISSFKAEGKLAFRTIYEYIEKDGSPSGKRLFDNPVYHTEVNWDDRQPGLLGCWTIHSFHGRLLKIKSNALSGLTRSGAIVGYERVVEKRVDKDSIALGKTVFKYGYFSNTTYRGIPYTPIAEDALGSGVLLAKEVYDSEDFLLQEELNEYSFGSFESSETLPRGFRVWPEVITACTSCNDVNYLFDVYTPLVPKKLQLVRSKVVTYDERAKINERISYHDLVNETSYTYYDNTNLVHRTVNLYSEQDSITTIYKYPFNFTPHVYNMMDRRGMGGMPVSTSVYRSGKLVSTSRYEFDFLNSPKILPSRQFVQFGDNPEEPRMNFKKYNSMGNPEEIQIEGDVTNTIIWNDAGTRPIAKIKGASRNQVWYTSFEGHSEQGDLQDAWSGRKSKVNPTINASDLPPGEYMLTYMVKRTGPGWGMRVQKITLQSRGYTASLVGRIDEVRIYPIGSQMLTVSYDEGGRVMTECSVNGTAKRYDYDNFGRLESVKDEDSNLLKAFNYRYHNE